MEGENTDYIEGNGDDNLVRIAAGNDCRIGFAGPTVILNTMCGGDQVQYDADCPADFFCDNGETGAKDCCMSFDLKPKDKKRLEESVIKRLQKLAGIKK